MPENNLSTANAETIISITGMHKWFGDFHVLKDIDLEVKQGERIVICGPSGSGKSTLIRCINRLEEHQQGTIVVDGTELTQDLKNIEIIRSEVGMVFQQFNLFPHLTVLENLTLAPIWVRKTPKQKPKKWQCSTWKGLKFLNSPKSTQVNFRGVSNKGLPLLGHYA